MSFIWKDSTNYKDKRWIRKRKRILRRDNYLYQESKRYGKTAETNTVYHLYPVEKYPGLIYVDWHLISLSDDKHNKMHDRYTNKITELGRQWQERVKDVFGNRRIQFLATKNTVTDTGYSQAINNRYLSKKTFK